MPLVKCYINNEKKERECGDCHEIKPFLEFTIVAGRPVTYCKRCRAKSNFNRDQEGRMTANPDKFIQCENCLYIRSVRNIKECPKCDGKEQVRN